MSEASGWGEARPTTRWLASFEHPEEFWHSVEMAEEDAAEQVAQAI